MKPCKPKEKNGITDETLKLQLFLRAKGLSVREPRQDNKRDGTVNEFKKIQSFLHKFVI